MRHNHAVIEVVPSTTRDGGKDIRATKPRDVVDIRSKDELEEQLQHYKKPFVAHVVKATVFAQRHYVEWIRPALRFYCKLYKTDVPAWLKDDSFYLSMKDDQRRRLFGQKPLRIHEFKAMKFKRAPAKGDAK